MKRRVLSFIIALTLCLNLCPAWALDAGEGTDSGLCPHHPSHTDECGYDPGSPGAPCTFACQICPVEDLIGKLPGSVSENNREQVQAQLSEINALYGGLTADEQQQVDLSPCMALLDQLGGMELAVLSDDLNDSSFPDNKYELKADYTMSVPFKVNFLLSFRTNGYTFTGTDSTAIQVTGAGKLYLTGRVVSAYDTGVEVQSGGFLSITEPETFIGGGTCALYIASGAEVHLSTGKYSARGPAIQTEDGNLAALLEPGYAFFDSSGKLLLPDEAANATTIVIDQCSDHSGKSYTHTLGTTNHTWTCPYCGTGESEPCTFTFDQNGNGTCNFCENTLAIAVDESDLSDLVYDGTMKPEDVEITVTLTDGSNKALVKDTDYRVVYDPRIDAGEITVTVTGITFNGTFIKTYTVAQDKPGLSWANSNPTTVNYDGAPVEAGDLPGVSINIQSQVDNLQGYLQYSYRKQGDTDYTDGLPKDAGTYEVIVSLPVLPNFEGAVSDPIMLTIAPINPIVTVPVAKTLTYNRNPQVLVTAGILDPVAVADGLAIEFATEEKGTFSTEIPSGTNAGDYTVWYQVVGLTDNYIAPNPNPAKIDGVEILRKQITPIVTLSDYTYLYDGGFKEPKVTVKDEDDVTVLLDTEYEVAYVNNRNVSTEENPAKVVVSDKDGGNYEFETVEVEFKITLREQATLSITSRPNTVIYRDQFTLGTQGGSGNGNVTWNVTDGTDVATVDPSSGQVTVIGHGSATVQATKSGSDPATGVVNYEDATASWTFTADKKPVTATVTANDKSYDGNNTAVIRAVVEQGVLPGDEITITGLTGTFSDANAGVDKTVAVTVDTDGKPVDTNGQPVTITGNNSEHYDVSYSSLTVKATIRKAVADIKTPPDAANLTYNGSDQELINDSMLVVDPADMVVEYALSEDGPYSTAIPKGTNAGKYTVWYRVQETGNYTGLAPASVDVEIGKKPVTPTITLSGDGLTVEDDGTYSYIYDGNAKEPVVTLTEADGTTLIPAGEYTVEYSGNVNVGTATVTVTAKADGNYTFTPDAVTENFTINKEKAKVVAPPKAAGDPLTFNTRDQKLVIPGTGYGGTMVYCVDNENGTYLETIPAKTDAADYTVYYKVEGDGNHSDSDVGSVTVTIAPKTVKDPTIELFDGTNPLVSYTYDGTAKEPTVKVLDGSTLIDPKEYNLVYEDNIDAGKGTVHITDKPDGNYTVTGSATFVIVKADIVFNPDPSAAIITYDGNPHELLIPGTTSGGEVLYALNSPTSTYAAAIPEATEAGDYVVYYKVTGDKNHNDLAVQSVPVTIQRKPLTSIIIELSPEGFKYDGTPKLPEVTVKDGKTVLPEEEYEWECTLNGTAVTEPTNVGTYTITISDASDGNYDLTGLVSPANEATFTIGQIPQEELVIGGKPTTTNYGDTFQLAVSGGSGTSTETWNATGPATVDSTGGVTITGVGEVTVTVEKAADTNYLAAQAQWTFTAAPKPVTASVVVADKDYDGNTTATVTSASITTINSDTVTIDPASITATFDTPSVGTGKTVTLDTSKVKVTGDTAKYAISYPDTASADITQATTTITTAPEGITPLTYNGQPQALVTAGETNVGFLVYSLDGTSFSPEIPTGTDAGTYNVYYKVDGTADYTGVAVNAPPVTVTIAPKAITPVIEVSETSYLYDGTKKDPKITVKDGKTVIDEDQYTVTWDDPGLTAAKTYTATIENVTGGNYTFSEAVTVEIVAAEQDALHITGKPDHVYYGDTVTTLDTTGGSGTGTVTWSITPGGTNSIIDPSTGELTVKDTGSITVTAERAVPNYGTVSDTWTFTVEPKQVVAEVTIASKDYDGTTDIADGDIKAAVKSGDLVDSADSITITGLKGAYDNANAGTNKPVTLNGTNVSITADTAKYTVSIPASAQADITPRQVTVTVTLSDHDLQTDDDGTYYYLFDGTEKTPAVTVTASDDGATLAASDYSVSYSDNKNASTENAKAAVTVTPKAGGNYTFDGETVNFEIRKGAAVLTSTPQAKDLTYKKDTAQDLVTVGTATGGTVWYSSDGTNYSETIPTETNAGTYTVYYMVKGDANHADTAPGQVSVTIKRKEITPKITLSQDSYEYNGTAHEPTATVEDGSDTIAASEYDVSYRDNINAGTATVIVSATNGGNYIVNGTATFEITKAAPTYTDPEGKPGLQYSGAPQELVKAGVTGDGTVVYSVDGGNFSPAIPTATAVGTYTIDYQVWGDANHSDVVSTTPLTVEIEKNTVANPAITLSSDTFRYNGSQQKPTITVCDDNGILIPQHEYTVKIEGTNGNVGMVDVDTYTVTVTTPSTSNYDITDDGIVNTRTFKIVPADQETISITGTQAQVRYGDTIQLGVTGGTSSGTVTWTVTDTDGNAVSSTIGATGLLTVKDVGGPITVTAKCSAGTNYTEVSATWEFSAARKQVTAVVTADDRNFIDNNTTATVHASVPGSELVSGDSITISGVTGTFDDPNVGTDKRVTVDSTNAAATGTNAENYEITYPATTTASILAEGAMVVTDPAPNTLTYDASQAQALVTAGTATGGIMVYSLDGTNFTAAIPTAKDAGTYTVHFKAQGDGNHTDSAVGTMQATIGKQSVRPQIELTPPSAQYDGKVKRPEVTLRDGANNVIPASEYKVTYVSDNSENWTDQGTYTVKVEDISGGNYVVADSTETFTISTTAQNPLEIVNKPGLVYYGDTFTLSAVGGSGSNPVTWSVDDASVVEIDANGFVKIIGTGPATITATKSGGTNYDTVTATYPLSALKKPITAIVTAEDKVFDGSDEAKVHVAWKDGDLVGDDTINTAALTGTFDNPNVGQNKTVTINGGPISDSRYDIKLPATTTASILKADAVAPTVTANNRDYDGTAQPLVTGGGTSTVYSDARDGVYSSTVPTGTNAGTYTVWYKEQGDANHNDSAPQAATVTISPKTLTLTSADITLSGNDLQDDGSGNYSYVYDGTEKKPAVTIVDGAAVVPASEYTVTYSNNKNVSTDDVKATVTITSNAGGNYTFDEQTVNFTITSATAQLTSSPQPKDLTYTGQAQELVNVGTAVGGYIEYSLDGTNYSASIPTETGAGTYTVTYKVVGEGNYADNPNTWTVSVTIKPKEIVSPKVTVTGTYTYDGTPKEPTAVTVEDGTTPIPGSEYTVTFRDNVEAGTATVVITNANGGNYIVNGTGTFTIGKADATVEGAPTGLENLPYNGTAQELVTAGSASGGTMVYSLSKTGEYSPVIPTQMAVADYTVWYKVQGDSNHNDTEPASVTASIVTNTVNNPIVQVTPESVTYNGKKQEPAITIIDDKGFTIDGSEYTVTYADENGNDDLTQVGTYTLTITGTDTHYTFGTTATFEILPADQTPLTITGKREHVYYGDKFQLSTEGGSGTVTWAVDDGTLANITNGLLTITGVGSVTVTATSTAPGYANQTATWSFYAERKPVTAVVTAAAKPYDGDTTATVTASLQTSDLVSGDTVKIKLSGSFEDPNAGTDKKVNVDSSNPDFTGSTDSYENYNITYPATTTASILKANIDPTKVTAPAAATGLEYTGLAQALVTAGSSTQGTLEYSTDNIVYSASLPTGTDAKSYDVWYRVKGDGNHNDTAGTKLAAQVTIAPQTVNPPTIELTPTGVSYDGAVHKPSVTVKDSHGRVIPDSEYTVAYDPIGDWKDVGEYKVTITDVTGGNYDITGTDAKFEILIMGQSPLSITNQPGEVHYGDTFTLSTTGGSGSGTVSWVSSKPEVATISENGLVKVLKSGGPVTITATKQTDGNYGATTAIWTFSAEKRSATAIVTSDDKPYDGGTTATIHIAWKDGDLLNGDTISLTLTGTFNNANAGSNKTVTITGTVPDNDKYAVTYNTTTTASITPKSATVTGVTAVGSLTYSGQPQALVNAGTVDSGNVMYSLDGGATYSLDVPKATNAGTYTVWYKAVSSGNYMDSTPASVPVTIDPKTVDAPEIELSPETFDYDGTAKKPDVVVKDGNIVIPTSEYTVSYSNNTAVGTATVTISDNTGGNYNVETKTASFTIKAGTATLVTPPEERDLTYTGKSQALVTAGTAVNGQVMYSVDGGAYGLSIPRGTDAGDYEISYKVVGNEGYADTSEYFMIVTIQPKQVTPIIRLENRSSYSVPYNGDKQEPEVTVYVESKLYTGLYDVSYANNINVGTAEVTVQNIGGNYQFLEFKTFTITKGKAEFSTAPTARTGLVYNGTAQNLVVPGIAKNNSGTVFYSLDNVTYSPAIPTAINRGSYTVFAKVQGSSNYEESDVAIIPVEISVNTVQNPTVSLSASSFPYTGSEQKPTVTVTDDDGNVISADEYTVTYSDNVNVGTAKINIKSKTSGNYSFTATAEFQILGADQPTLTITGKPDAVYYGDTFTLGTTGGSGTVAWTVEGNATSLGNGQFKINSSGSITIKATAGGSSDTWTFYAYPRPVNAVVTATNKPYDGNNNATLTFTVNSGLVSGDIAFSGDAAGYFADTDAGTNKTVIITGLTVSDEISKKYDIQYPATTTASILPAAADVAKAPEKIDNLKYTGLPQALVTSGEAANGNMAYSLDGVNYSFTVPEGTDAKTYNVWYKAVAANENYKDSAPVKVENVAIAVNADTPSVMCTPNTLQYDGTAKTPTVVVRDAANRIIPESEYTVTVNDNTPAIAVGKYQVTVTDNPGGNYEFTSPVTATDAFEIVAASQNPLTVVNKPSAVYYGDTFRLSATGGSGSGAIKWSIEGSAATIKSDGTVTVTGVGGFTVKAYREASDGYSDSNTDSVPFYANPKPVTPTVTAEDKSYDGKTDATLKAVLKPGDLVGTDSIVLDVTGVFATADAGVNKQVTITSGTPSGVHGNYVITWPDTTTASIYKVDAKLQTAPGAVSGLSYNGSAQALVTAGATAGNIGTIVYSTSQNGVYSENIPTGTNAGEYTVWYKVEESVNYTGIAATELKVEIAKANPDISTKPTAATGTTGQKLSEIAFSNGGATGVAGTFAWKDGTIEPGVGTSEQYMIFTPDDEANYNTVTFQITVTVQQSTNGGTDNTTNSTPPSWQDAPSTFSIPSASGTPAQTTVQDGTASTVVSDKDGSDLVREAVANQSQNVVIKPEITGDVTKTEVFIPSSTVSQLSSETDAALTVSSPVADVTISNAALDTLSQAGGTVSVVAEKTEGAVVLSLAVDGEVVEEVPGGVTLTVPAEDAGPGTVAVLVHEDGTREIIRKSVAADGVMSIPLSGSATVEIVDNSKEFDDVPPESWAADAVSFASAHELFGGTSETTFSPDEAMSRGMLATALYRLEGSPELDLTDAFSDVGSDAWYAEGVTWAVERGIADGYGDGQFGPDDSITREQFVVMLWRYAGSPEASSQALGFDDAGEAAGYAQEALCWAVENGILSGVSSDTLDPKGTATRAQAAQLLKNFMENT